MTRRPGPNVRQRAKRACGTCNARRVKCNVTEQQPCRNCVIAGTPCELIESRRGKHPRRKKSIAETTTLSPQDSLVNHPIANQVPSAPSGSTGASSHIQEPYSVSFRSPSVSNQTHDREHARHGGPEDIQEPSPTESLQDSIYLGESTSLTIIQDNEELANTMDRQNKSPESTGPRLFYSMPKAHEDRPADNTVVDLLATPEKRTRALLFDAYFRWFHPNYPIIDQGNFIMHHHQDLLSPLLLHAVLLLGATHCEEQILKDAGYSGRLDAKRRFYKHAKLIYDADTEPDYLTIIQAVFLLSYWRAGPQEKKDTRHWLGIAITMCQTKALHRKSIGKHPQSDRVKKRIWWSIYIRERQCATGLGLPIRIRDEDCDVDPLTMNDFVDEMRPLVDGFAPLTRLNVDYIVQMCDLSKLLGDIVCSTYLPNQKPDPFRSSQMLNRIHESQRNMPQTMRLEHYTSGGSGFFPVLLQMTYNNLVILVYRPVFLKEPHEGGEDGADEVIQAACRNSRLLEDLISNDLLQHGHLHLVTIIFNTLCIHTVLCKRSTGIAKSMAENRAHLCLMGLKELGKRWDITNWILDLFLHYLDRSTVRRLQPPDLSEPSTGTDASLPQQPAHDDQTSAANSLVALQQSTASAPMLEVPPMRDMVVDAQQYQPYLSSVDDLLMNQIENDFVFGEGNGLSLDPPDADLLALFGISAFSPAVPVPGAEMLT